MAQFITEAQKDQVNGLLQEKIFAAEAIFKRPFPLPEIQYNQRGRVAGTAHLERWMIRLNPILLHENGTRFIEEVVPHELAHLIVYHCYGKVRPHGHEWRYVMEEIFKQPAKTRHHFDTRSVMGRVYPYRCDCQVHQLTIRRHNRVQRGERQYYCRQCGEMLVEELC